VANFLGKIQDFSSNLNEFKIVILSAMVCLFVVHLIWIIVIERKNDRKDLIVSISKLVYFDLEEKPRHLAIINTVFINVENLVLSCFLYGLLLSDIGLCFLNLALHYWASRAKK